MASFRLWKREARKWFHIWLFSHNVSFSKVAWPGHRGMEAAKSAASTGKESVSDMTKILVFVTQRRVCRSSTIVLQLQKTACTLISFYWNGEILMYWWQNRLHLKSWVLRLGQWIDNQTCRFKLHWKMHSLSVSLFPRWTIWRKVQYFS